MKYLTEYEKLFIELVHLLSYGSELEYGLTFREVTQWLITPIPQKEGKNAIECLELEGADFIEEVRQYLSS